MYRRAGVNERLLAQHLLLAALAIIGTPNGGNTEPTAKSRRRRTNNSRCRCCYGIRTTKR